MTWFFLNHSWLSDISLSVQPIPQGLMTSYEMDGKSLSRGDSVWSGLAIWKAGRLCDLGSYELEYLNTERWMGTSGDRSAMQNQRFYVLLWLLHCQLVAASSCMDVFLVHCALRPSPSRLQILLSVSQLYRSKTSTGRCLWIEGRITQTSSPARIPLCGEDSPGR